MGTTVLSIIQADLARTREIRTDLAAVEDAAHTESRALNAKEEAKFATGRDEIARCEARVQEMLRQAEATAGMSYGLARLGIDTDVNTGRSLPGGRTIGGIAPVAFTDDTLRELHDAYLEGRAHSVNAETRAITGAPMAAIPTYNTDPVAYRREPTRIAALMPTQPVQTAQATYYRASAAAAAADAVATGATKPESTPGWEAVNVTIRKIAHYTDVPTEYLSDFPSFAQVIGTELTAGLIHAENGQLIDGTGTAPDLTGMLTTSGILTYAPAGAEDYFESVLKAITQLRTGTAYTDADTVLLHPTDWQTILLTRDTDDGLVVHHNPVDPAASTLWGKRVVLTTGLTVGTAIVANMAEGALVFERDTPRILVDPYSQSNKNLVRFICEERLAFGSPRPAAVLKLTFNDGA